MSIITHHDILTYVNGRMGKYINTRPDLSTDARVMDSLRSTFGEVIRQAQGAILWAKLVVIDIIEGLIQGESPYRHYENLSAIPGDGDLQGFYSGFLLRLMPNYLCEAFIMLPIAYSATKPITFILFFHALDPAGAGSKSGDWVMPPHSKMKKKKAFQPVPRIS